MINSIRSDNALSPCLFCILSAALAIVVAGCDSNTVEKLARELQSEDADVRYRAAKQLDDLEADAGPAVEALVAALSDNNARVRYRVVKTLSKVDDEIVPASAVPDLVKMLSDEDSKSRYYAAKVLEKLDKAAEEAIPALIDALKADNTAKVRYYVIRCLKNVASKAQDAVPELEKAAKNEDGKVRKMAVRTLDKIVRKTQVENSGS